jgi:hypothetical protein
MKHVLLHYAQSDETLLTALCAIGDRVQNQYVIRKVVISRATCGRYGFVSLPGNDCEDADIPELIEATQPLAHLCCLVPRSRSAETAIHISR